MNFQIIAIALAVVGGIVLWISGVMVGTRLGLKRAGSLFERERLEMEQQIDHLSQRMIEESHKAKQAESSRLAVEGELSGAVVKLGQMEVKIDKARNIIKELSGEREVLLRASQHPQAIPRPSNLPRPPAIPRPVRKP